MEEKECNNLTELKLKIDTYENFVNFDDLQEVCNMENEEVNKFYEHFDVVLYGIYTQKGFVVHKNYLIKEIDKALEQSDMEMD